MTIKGTYFCHTCGDRFSTEEQTKSHWEASGHKHAGFGMTKDLDYWAEQNDKGARIALNMARL